MTKKTNANATVHPIDDYMLVRRITSATAGASADPASYDDDDDAGQGQVFRGVIAAQGPGMPTMSGDRMGMVVTGPAGLIPVQPGDGIIYRAQHAQELTIESGKFDLIRFRDSVAVLKAD